MITFRKTLMATTMLVGLAIFTTDAAQAGPNGGPSLGSISGFSSMRMDFNRVGGPNRALSRADMRVVPITVKNTDKGDKSGKPAKSAAKKGINTARVSNPKSISGGKGKESVSGGQNLHIPAALAEIYRITGGNLDDLAQIAALADQIKAGPLVVANPLFPAQGDDAFTPPEFAGDGPKGGEQSDRNFLDGWAGYSSAPGGPDTSKTGWAGICHHISTNYDGQGSRRSTYYDDATDRHATVTSRSNGNETSRDIVITGTDESGTRTRDEIHHSTYTDNDGDRVETRTSTSSDTVDNGDGTTTTTTFWTHRVKENGVVVESESRNSSRTTDSEGNVIERTEEKSGQPVEEGTGRPGRSGWCSPTGGCRIASPVPPRRIIPNENYQTVQTNSQLPNWATDPCPDCTARGGSGGRTGYTPQDEGDGAPGAPGGPPT